MQTKLSFSTLKICRYYANIWAVCQCPKRFTGKKNKDLVEQDANIKYANIKYAFTNPITIEL